MNREGLWTLLKDVILTGTGVAIIVNEMLVAHPSDPLLVVAMALTGPTLVDHTRAILSPPQPPSHGGTGQEHSPSSSSSGHSQP